jgi:hypothetical protein
MKMYFHAIPVHIASSRRIFYRPAASVNLDAALAAIKLSISMRISHLVVLCLFHAVNSFISNHGMIGVTKQGGSYHA